MKKIIIAIIFLSIFQLVLISQEIAGSGQINDLDKKINEISRENQEMEVEIASKSSLRTIAETARTVSLSSNNSRTDDGAIALRY
jgi:cell division protein FtsL